MLYDTGDALWALKLGSIFPLLRIGEWRLSLDAGFLGEFYLEDQRHLSLGIYFDLGRIGPR